MLYNLQSKDSTTQIENKQNPGLQNSKLDHLKKDQLFNWPNLTAVWFQKWILEKFRRIGEMSTPMSPVVQAAIFKNAALIHLSDTFCEAG